MTALVLGEALLRAVTRPAIGDDAGAEPGCKRLRPIIGARIDHHDVVAQARDRLNRSANAVGLVARDDEDRKRRHSLSVSFLTGPAQR